MSDVGLKKNSVDLVCVFRDQAAMHIKQFIGGEHLHVRTCARADVPPFSVFRKLLDGLR